MQILKTEKKIVLHDLLIKGKENKSLRFRQVSILLLVIFFTVSFKCDLYIS